MIVIPDNDDAGRNHVNDVARSLAGSAARIRLLELPGLPPKGDVTDWFAAGGTVEAFNEFVDQARAWTDDGSKAAVQATPWQWIDPQTVPPRSWLYGHHIIRKFVSATVAPGGTGKSSLIVAEVLEIVSGKPLLLAGSSPLRVWYLNLEDPRDEIERRIAATCMAYQLQPADLAGRLFVDSGRDQPCVIARYNGHRQIAIDDMLVAGLIAEIRRHKIDVLVIDPFKRAHQLDENDNTAVDLVVQQLARIADEGNCAVSLVHHTRKVGGGEITAETSRGSKSLVDGCRAVRVLNVMSKEEAERAGITDEPRRYFRTYPDKLNLAPPPDVSEWCRLQSIHLGNAPNSLGDSVGVAMPWNWPDAFAGINVATLQAVQRRIEGGAWREDTRAEAWAGKAVADVLKLDLDRKRDRARVLTLLKIWIKTGVLKVVERPDGHRKPKTFVEVGEWAS